MRTELIVIETDADLAEANELVAALMNSESDSDMVRLRAQAKLVEAYERRCWPRKAPSVPELSMTMVRRLRERFGISADLLIPHGEPRNAAA